MRPWQTVTTWMDARALLAVVTVIVADWTSRFVLMGGDDDDDERHAGIAAGSQSQLILITPRETATHTPLVASSATSPAGCEREWVFAMVPSRIRRIGRNDHRREFRSRSRLSLPLTVQRHIPTGNGGEMRSIGGGRGLLIDAPCRALHFLPGSNSSGIDPFRTGRWAVRDVTKNMKIH